jgi:G3E family GTPase
VTTASLSWDPPVDWASFAVWLSAQLHAHGRRILRLKALLDVSGSEGPVLVDAVAHHVYPPQHLSGRPDGARSRLVVVTQDLPAQLVTAGLTRFLELD